MIILGFFYRVNEWYIFGKFLSILNQHSIYLKSVVATQITMHFSYFGLFWNLYPGLNDL